VLSGRCLCHVGPLNTQYLLHLSRTVWDCLVMTLLLNCLLTFSLHRAVLLQKLTGSQPVNKFPTFYVTRRFITTVPNARHLSLSSARSIQSTPPHPTSSRSILILSCTKSHVPFPFLTSYHMVSPLPRHISVSYQGQFLQRAVVSTSPNHQAGGPPLFSCPRLLIRYIHSYPPYCRPFLHGVVTETH
jgi:hypothetical protein